MELTKHQNDIMLSLLSDPSDIVFLSAPAGYGKSFTTAKMIKHLGSLGRIVTITSTTHKATAVLNQMMEQYNTGITATTIHSYLKFKIFYNYGKEVLRKIKDSVVINTDYLIIDEASMLTKELYDDIKLQLQNDVIRKVILVGDACQLVLDRRVNFDDIKRFELTQPMRQSKSYLLDFLTALRESIDKKSDVPKILRRDNVYITDDHKEFIELYCKDDSERCILAYTNQVVKTYNRNIIKHLHKKDNEYNVGDVVMLRSPIFDSKGNSVLRNNDIFKIDHIEELANELKVYDKYGRSFYIPKTKTYFDEVKNQLSDDKNWKDFYRFVESRSFVHHTYALTIHRSQGSTFETIYLDMNSIEPMCNERHMLDEIKRLVYVAMSRPSSKVVVFKGGERKWEHFKTKKIQQIISK